MRGDTRGVVGLPLKLTVMTIVGIAALGVLLSGLQSYGCIAPRGTQATASPTSLLLSEGSRYTLRVQVRESGGNPVEKATVIIGGLGTGATGVTDRLGQATATSGSGARFQGDEEYLSLEIKPPPSACLRDYKDPAAVKAVRRGG
ncbi:MAG: Ig-like domain-containing protein [Euryarchaeota archaeon]|nr:Ig-like domain-containing protein [Euryarchaeota archaeon]